MPRPANKPEPEPLEVKYIRRGEKIGELTAKLDDLRRRVEGLPGLQEKSWAVTMAGLLVDMGCEQCEAARIYGVKKQSLSRHLRRLKVNQN